MAERKTTDIIKRENMERPDGVMARNDMLETSERLSSVVFNGTSMLLLKMDWTGFGVRITAVLKCVARS